MNMFPQHARKAVIENETILYWNTQRMYTPGGQRMVARHFTVGDLPQKDVVFIDLDRHITGIIPDCILTENAIMDAYDKNQYHPPGSQDDYCALRTLFSLKDKLVKLFV